MVEPAYERVSELLNRVLELPPDQRPGAVAELAGGDGALEAELKSLLRYHVEDGFLAGPAAIPPDALDEPKPGPLPEQIGNYKVRCLLGRGGMGAVYEAEHPTLGFRVAVKVLNESLFDDESRLRFELEKKVLTRLHHQGIARIIDAGSHGTGRGALPYLVLELVDGVDATEWVRQQRPGVDEIVRLVLGVCEAIEHAHQNGVIHRDVKPSNVLVTRDGTPKVVDFGIARPVRPDGSLPWLSRSHHSVVGTLAYMSPEQCEAEDVDVRCDVYSIGVLLHELVSGSVPVDVSGRSLVQAARRICDEPPAPLMFRGRPAPRDLRAIVGKALEKNRERRYASVSSLADDLRAYLSRLPVVARPAGPGRRLAHWGLQHPVLFSLAASVSLASTIVGGAILGSWWYGWEVSSIELGSGFARLLSRSGNEIHRWEGAIDDAKLISLPPELGSGKGAVLARARAGVEAYACANPDKILWSTASLEMRSPGPRRDTAERAVDLLQVDDFLPEVPGCEILVIERLAPFSSCVVRLLDRAGRVRYQVWTDGHVHGAVAFPDMGRMVLAGFSSIYPWASRAVDLRDQIWPIVVFALDVVDGHVSDRFVVESSGAVDPTVAWYRWVGPVEALRRSRRMDVGLNSRMHQTGELAVEFFIGSKDTARGPEYVSFHLSPNGEEVGRIPSDEYRVAVERGELPQPSAWMLLDVSSLPPPAGAPHGPIGE